MQAGRDSGYPLKATTLVSGPKPMSEAGKDRGAARYHCRSVLGNSPCSRHSIVFREATLLASPPLSILPVCLLPHRCIHYQPTLYSIEGQ
jgi:hypothetical protein